MKLDTKNWKNYTVGDIFDILNGKGITRDEIEEHPGNFEAIQSGAENNAVIGKIDKEYCLAKGYTVTEEPCLTVARSGTSGFVSLHGYGCVVGDSAKILLLKDKSHLNIMVLAFLQTLLMANQFKYNYGRKVTEELYRETVLKLPTDKDGKPDWESIENFMGGLHTNPITTSNKSSHKPLETKKWSKFKVIDLFTVKKGKRLTADDQTEGNTIYIGAIDSNNGVAAHIGQKPMHESNTITLSYNGSVGEAFYQPNPFWATDDVNVLYFKPSNNHKFNQYIGLFIATLLRQEKYRFSYGRKWVLKEMEDTVLHLPVDPSGNPDWDFMENYIKSLPYGDRLIK